MWAHSFGISHPNLHLLVRFLCHFHGHDVQLALVSVDMRADFNMVADVRFKSIGIQDFPRFIVVVRHEHDLFAVNLHRALHGLEWSSLW